MLTDTLVAKQLDRSAVADFYDRLWTAYTPSYEASAQHVDFFFAPQEIAEKRVLDAGCGTGIFAHIFADKGARQVVAIDISKQSLTKGKGLSRQVKKNLSFGLADLLALPFQQETFDIVWCWGAAHHTTQPERALQQLAAVVKPGGTLLLALYRKAWLTGIHDFFRRQLKNTPVSWQRPLARCLSIVLEPMVRLMRRRDKLRGGEKFEELVLDWFFNPLRHHLDPEPVLKLLGAQGFQIERFIPAAGRLDSTSNFIIKTRKRH